MQRTSSSFAGDQSVWPDRRLSTLPSTETTRALQSLVQACASAKDDHSATNGAQSIRPRKAVCRCEVPCSRAPVVQVRRDRSSCIDNASATEAGRAPLVVLVRGSRYPPSLISAALIFQRARTFSLAFSGGNRWRSQGKRVAPNRGRTIANTSNQGRVKRPISSDRVLPNGAEYQLRFALRMASQVASHKTIRSCPTITSPVKPAARTPSVKFVIA